MEWDSVLVFCYELNLDSVVKANAGCGDEVVFFCRKMSAYVIPVKSTPLPQIGKTSRRERAKSSVVALL